MRVIFFFAFILYSNAFAYTCYSSHCEDIRVGLGIHHSRTYDTGAYLSLYIGGHWERFYLAGGAMIGQMYPSFAPTIDSKIQNYNSLLFSAYAHIGAKLGGENPLFLYVEALLERYDIGENHTFSANHTFVGAYMAYHARLSSFIVLEVGAGISPSILRKYVSESAERGFLSQSSTFDSSFRLESFIGMRFKRGNTYIKKSDISVRLNAIFYHNRIYDYTPLILPPRQDYAIMLECAMSLEHLLSF